MYINKNHIFAIILKLILADSCFHASDNVWRVKGRGGASGQLWGSQYNWVMVCSFTWKRKKDYALSSKSPGACSDLTHWKLQGHYPLSVCGKLQLCESCECSALLFPDYCYRSAKKCGTRTREMCHYPVETFLMTMTRRWANYTSCNESLHFLMHGIIQWEKMPFVNVLKILSLLSPRLKAPHQYYQCIVCNYWCVCERMSKFVANFTLQILLYKHH